MKESNETEAEEGEADLIPSYDGRLIYFNHVKEYLTAIAKASVGGEFVEWLRSVQGYFAIVQPFIKKKDAEDINNRLNIIESKYILIMGIKENRNTGNINIRLNKDLRLVTQDLFMASKHLLLPIKTDGDFDYTEENFARESDL